MSSLQTPQGVEIVASAGGMYDLSASEPSHDQVFLAKTSWWLTRKYVCGHRGPRSFSLNVFGSNVQHQGDAFCPDCAITAVRKVAIWCALCGLAIVPGNAVALYKVYSPGVRLFVGVHTHNGVLGCMRQNCCLNPGLFAGHWEENGFEPRFGGVSAVEFSAGV